MKTRILSLVAALLAAVAQASVSVNGTTASLSVQNAAGNSGACTALSCAQSVLTVSSGTVFTPTWAVQNTIAVNVAGTWTGTLTFQASYDDQATWNSFPCLPAQTAATNLTPQPVTTATANGNWVCDVGGATGFRTVMSTLGSGTAVVIQEAMLAVGSESVSQIPLVTDSQQRIVQGMSQGASYNGTALVTVPTSATSLFQIGGPDGGLASQQRGYLRELDVCLDPSALQTTAGPRKLILFATTATQSGGTFAATNALDPVNPTSNVNIYTGPTTTPAVGSVAEAQALDEFEIFVPTAASTNANPECIVRQYDGTRGLQPIAFGGCNGAACGLASFADAGVALADKTGGAGGTGNYIITAKWSVESK